MSKKLPVVYLRPRDSTGSLHVCTKGDPGAVAYMPVRLSLKTIFEIKKKH